MPRLLLPSRTAAFWQWFQENAAVIGRLIDSSEAGKLDNLLSVRVHALDRGLAWEVGPGLKKRFAFVVSPNGNPEKLEITKAIVAAAPKVRGWEIHPAKPPKKWDLRFLIGDEPIDARQWRYALTGYNDGEFYDVTILAPDLGELTMKDQRIAGRLVVEGILGERVGLEKIGDVEVVHEANDESRFSSISVLSEHLRSLTKHCGGRSKTR